MALTAEHLNAFALQDTKVIADALIDGSLIGTEVGDRVLATLQNHPERYRAVVATLDRRNAWESAA